MVRAAGLKLIVENDTLLVNDVQAGWNAAPFYATLDWAQYQQARAQTAVTVAQTMQPDYLVVVEEPDTEAANSGQNQANTPSGSACPAEPDADQRTSVWRSGHAGGRGNGNLAIELPAIHPGLCGPAGRFHRHAHLPDQRQQAAERPADREPRRLRRASPWQ